MGTEAVVTKLAAKQLALDLLRSFQPAIALVLVSLCWYGRALLAIWRYSLDPLPTMTTPMPMRPWLTMVVS